MKLLNMIIEQKLLEISMQSLKISIEELKNIKRETSIINLKDLLLNNECQIIAEINQKIELDFIKTIKELEKNNVSAFSILTDKEFFNGSLQFLNKIKKNIKKPIIQKDFIISEYQIYQSYINGSDAIILIAEMLDIFQLQDLYSLGKKLGLEVIIEFHNVSSINKINKINPDIVLASSRNLDTMKVDINKFNEFYFSLSEDTIKIAEGGIKTVQHFNMIKQLKYDGVILGSMFLKKENPLDFIQCLLKKT